jgi:hypothetical protein
VFAAIIQNLIFIADSRSCRRAGIAAATTHACQCSHARLCNADGRCTVGRVYHLPIGRAHSHGARHACAMRVSSSVQTHLSLVGNRQLALAFCCHTPAPPHAATRDFARLTHVDMSYALKQHDAESVYALDELRSDTLQCITILYVARTNVARCSHTCAVNTRSSRVVATAARRWRRAS